MSPFTAALPALAGKQNGQYSVGKFCISCGIVQAPFVLLIAISCSTPVYWITDMNNSPVRWVDHDDDTA